MKTTMLIVDKKQLFVDSVNIRAKEYETDEDLINSIKSEGIIEPLIVRQKDTRYGIVAGGRRFRAGIEAGLKEFPVIIKELNDNQAMGLSIQENWQSKKCPEIFIAEKVAELYKNLNTGMQHSEKVKWFEKEIGIKESTLLTYRNMASLGDNFKEQFMYTTRPARRIDTHSAEAIATDNYSPKEQVAIGKEIAGKTRKEAMSFIKKVKSYKDKPISEAIRLSKRIPETISFSVSFDLKVQRAIQKYAKEKDIPVVEVIRKSVEQFLRRGGYL